MNQQQETKTCKYCGSEIPKNAKICPNCRKKQSHKVRNTILIIFGILVVIGIFGAMFSGGGSNTTSTDTTSTDTGTTDSSTTTSSESESQSAGSTQSNFTVGETADNDGQTVTLDSVTTYAGTEYSKPPEGMEYIVFNWSFSNSSDTDFTPYSGMFDVYADGSAVQQYYGNTESKDIGSQTLINGTNETGSTTYEVPIGWQEIQIRVVQNVWTKQNVTFTVTSDQVS